MELFRSSMTELDKGYKCSTCGESFINPTSAKKHVNFAKKCRIRGVAPQVIAYQIQSRRTDRRVGGIESIDNPINQRERNQNVSNREVYRDQHDFDTDAAPYNVNENDILVDQARRNRSGMFP